MTFLNFFYATTFFFHYIGPMYVLLLNLKLCWMTDLILFYSCFRFIGCLFMACPTRQLTLLSLVSKSLILTELFSLDTLTMNPVLIFWTLCSIMCARLIWLVGDLSFACKKLECYKIPQKEAAYFCVADLDKCWA